MVVNLLHQRHGAGQHEIAALNAVVLDAAAHLRSKVARGRRRQTRRTCSRLAFDKSPPRPASSPVGACPTSACRSRPANQTSRQPGRQFSGAAAGRPPIRFSRPPHEVAAASLQGLPPCCIRGTCRNTVFPAPGGPSSSVVVPGRSTPCRSLRMPYGCRFRPPCRGNVRGASTRCPASSPGGRAAALLQRLGRPPQWAGCGQAAPVLACSWVGHAALPCPALPRWADSAPPALPAAPPSSAGP